MANGRPSRRAQISAMSVPSACVSSKSGTTCRARSTNSCTASYCANSATGDQGGRGALSGATGISCSPSIWSAARLVTMILRRGQVRMSSATEPAAGSTCSKIVEQEQHVLILYNLCYLVADRAYSVIPHTQCTRDGGHDLVWLGQCAERHEVYAVRVVIQHMPRDPECQSRLSNSAGSGQRQQRMSVE